MGYEVYQDEKEIVLSWLHPFTWVDYLITGYDIVCRETESEKIVHDMTLNDTTSSMNQLSVTLLIYLHTSQTATLSTVLWQPLML